MRNGSKVFWAGVLSLGLLSGAAFAEEKMGSVDLGRIFNEYGKTKDYEKSVTEKTGLYETDRNKKVTEIKQFQDKLNLLSEKEKEAKKPELENKVKTLQEYDRQKQTDLRKEQDEKMKELLKDIEETIKKYSEKEGFTIVFSDRALAYQSKKLDITDKIVELLNAGYKKQ